jgi:Transposase and inactivated derivatives
VCGTVRDEVVTFVSYWQGKTMISQKDLCIWIAVHSSKFHSWQRRYGLENRHNGKIPRDFWLLPWEKEAIIAYYFQHREIGYRRMAYMMLDENAVAVSPSSVYRVLSIHELLRRWPQVQTKKGQGFQQPLQAHEHWHVDFSYLSICGTFYYLCAILDGFSRYVVHWEIRESMTQADVQIVIQRAKERFPETHPRIISDNGPQFTAKELKEFLRLSGMTHVRTSPYYPQSNGKLERWNGTFKRECVRPKVPTSHDDAIRIAAEYIDQYNNRRLHSSIGFITPRNKMMGHAERIFQDRKQKLHEARKKRASYYQNLIVKEQENYSLSQTTGNSVFS